MEKVIERGDALYNNSFSFKKSKILFYFKLNKITLEKIDYIEKKSGINLSEIRAKIINIKNISKKFFYKIFKK